MLSKFHLSVPSIQRESLLRLTNILCLTASAILQKPGVAVADSGFGRGGPRIFSQDFADVVKQSPASKVNNIIFQYKRIWEF